LGLRSTGYIDALLGHGYRDAHIDDHEFENQLVFSIVEFIRSERQSLSANVDFSQDGKMTVIGTPRREDMTNDETYECMQSASASNPRSPIIQSINDIIEVNSPKPVRRKKVRFLLPNSPEMDPTVRDELQELSDAKEAGAAFILGHSYVKAKRGSSFLKKFVINVAYDFLRKNCRGPSAALNIPHISLLEVGMVYQV
jgi:KUP system potassium uptake protein